MKTKIEIKLTQKEIATRVKKNSSGARNLREQKRLISKVKPSGKLYNRKQRWN